jgi:L-alanine-DL-glutamate epimerase-like enolase superfamily enzyme
MSVVNGSSGRIERIDVIIVAVEFTEPETSATLERRGFENVLIRLETDDGAVGWGEASGASGAPVEAVRATVEALTPLAVGATVFDTEALRLRLLKRSRMANLRRLAHLALAGIDIACWDAAGQLLGRPVHELIGGAVRSEIDFYAYPLAKSPEQMAEEAASFVSDGFGVVYLKVGIDDRRDEQVVAAVREAIGDDVPIRVDVNEGWDLASARRMSFRLAPYRIEFIEQPIDARDVLGMRELRRATPVPLAVNQGIWSLSEAAQAIRLEACDIVVTGPLWLGGLLPLQRVGALCAETGIGFCRHTPPETSIATAAGLHVLATLPELLDGNQTYLYYLADDVSDSLAPARRARLPVPLRPGLGIDVDEARIAELAARYERDGSFPQVVSDDAAGMRRVR